MMYQVPIEVSVMVSEDTTPEEVKHMVEETAKSLMDGTDLMFGYVGEPTEDPTNE